MTFTLTKGKTLPDGTIRVRVCGNGIIFEARIAPEMLEDKAAINAWAEMRLTSFRKQLERKEKK